MLLALQQFDPDAVRVLRERLAPPVPPADFAGTDDHLNAFTHQVGDGPVEVIDVEREVVEFLAVDIGRTESTSLGVQFSSRSWSPSGLFSVTTSPSVGGVRSLFSTTRIPKTSV